jgi:hypothetical protein
MRFRSIPILKSWLTEAHGAGFVQAWLKKAERSCSVCVGL